jgi:hypothetical protein
MPFKGRIPRMYMFFDTGNPKLRSISKPEVELMGYLRMRSKKITKKTKNAIKMPFEGLSSLMFYVFRHGESDFEVYFETGNRINGVSAHAQ